ncbi:MAG: C40 family peptidase [Pyrinomonadaceae bacterium]|nr:C40 family peptidase [Pyrinomonadaceae bacterium]
MKFKKTFLAAVCMLLAATVFDGTAMAQQRDRVVKTTSSQPTNQPPVYVPAPQDSSRTTSASRPTLTNQIVVVNPAPAEKPLVKKTAASMSTAGFAAGRTAYGSSISAKIMAGIQARYGIPYLYGSTGPNRYDCSGFVWSVFNEAGVPFTRASARSLWSMSEEVYGDDRFKFGTLVFLNGLGHMGIVADENGFYHASSSKGITYSPFKGYWSSRIVGFRKLNPQGVSAVSSEK